MTCTTPQYPPNGGSLMNAIFELAAAAARLDRAESDEAADWD
jgi:hypothetical protein